MNKYLIIINALLLNRGSEALIRGLTASIKSADEMSDITVVSSEFDIDKREKLPCVDHFLCRYNYRSLRSPKRYIAAFAEKVCKKPNVGSLIRYRHLLDEVKNADHIIVIGADNYDATYNMFGMMHQMNVFLRKYANGKLWLYDCSIEKSHINSKILNDMMLFDGITVRETETEKALKESTISRNIYLYPDPAFVMEPEVYTGVSDLDLKNCVGVNVSNLILSPKYGNDKDCVFENYKNVINYCLNELNCKVLLIPHVMGNADLSALKKIKDMFSDEERVVLLSDENINAAQLKFIISQCRFIITARTHASIAAYSSCVPTLVLGYSVKSRGIAKDLFGTTEHYVVSVQNINCNDILLKEFKWIAENEQEIRSHLNSVMPVYVHNSKKMSKIFLKHSLIKNKSECCGCRVCANACPRKCITFEMDNSGFEYPMVDGSECINCGRCENVCPVRNCVQVKKNDGNFFAAYNKNSDITVNSSSGGVFSAIAEYILETKNGIIYGATVDNRFHVYHSSATTVEEYKQFRGSKYLQSNLMTCYLDCKTNLNIGKTVLFSGTPCQIAALYKYLNKDYENLYTVGVICHGVPSRTIFDKFIISNEVSENSRVVSYKWRDKKYGWGPNHISINFENGKQIITPSQGNPYQKGFLNNVYLRPSCYECKYANLPRVEDIALADFWGYQGKLSKDNKNNGISLVAVSNAKGQALFDAISNNLYIEQVTEKYAKSKSRHLWIHPIDNVDRQICAEQSITMSFEDINRKWINKSIAKKVIFKIKTKLKNK